MKPSDLVSTSGQRDDAGQSLLQTEMTDAVNSGIVGKADKSEKSLKGELYSVGKKAATGGAASAALSAVTKGRKGKPGAMSVSALASQGVHEALSGSELEGTDDLYHGAKGAYRAGRAVRNRLSGKSKPFDLKVSAKTAGKAAARGAVSSTLSDSELEGADSVYYGAKSSYRIGKGMKRRLSGRNALQSDKPLGQLSERSPPKGDGHSGRQAQGAGYELLQEECLHGCKQCQKTKAVNSAAKGTFRLFSSGSKGGIFAAIASPSTFFLIGFLLIFILLAAILGGGANEETEKNSLGNLTGVPLEVATELKGTAIPMKQSPLSSVTCSRNHP